MQQMSHSPPVIGSLVGGSALLVANRDTLVFSNLVLTHRVVNRLGQLTDQHHFPTPTVMQERLENDTVVEFKKLYRDPSVELG